MASLNFGSGSLVRRAGIIAGVGSVVGLSWFGVNRLVTHLQDKYDIGLEKLAEWFVGAEHAAGKFKDPPVLTLQMTRAIMRQVCSTMAQNMAQNDMRINEIAQNNPQATKEMIREHLAPQLKKAQVQAEAKIYAMAGTNETNVHYATDYYTHVTEDVEMKRLCHAIDMMWDTNEGKQPKGPVKRKEGASELTPERVAKYFEEMKKVSVAVMQACHDEHKSDEAFSNNLPVMLQTQQLEVATRMGIDERELSAVMRRPEYSNSPELMHALQDMLQAQQMKMQELGRRVVPQGM